MERVRIGVIGGTGVYEIETLTDVKEVHPQTPFGPPSDAILIGTLSDERVAFLARHGRGHRLMPTEVNARANIYALKSLGVERIICTTACGSMKEQYAPRHIVIPDQLFDRTRSRPLSFFGKGLAAHISFAEPFCPELSKLLYQAVKETGATVHMGGTYLIIEGPRFSTRGESRIFRQWGVDIIGMTVIPEAQLAREAEICYAAMAHVTDYDVWHEAEEAVTVAIVIKNLLANARVAKEAIRKVVPTTPVQRHCACATALQEAIITAKDRIPAKMRKELELLVGKYLQT
ncbi:MAG: S-methyl-5'-thioadenosine phosphorylase [Anaerolineae bacterium]